MWAKEYSADTREESTDPDGGRTTKYRTAQEMFSVNVSTVAKTTVPLESAKHRKTKNGWIAINMSECEKKRGFIKKAKNIIVAELFHMGRDEAVEVMFAEKCLSEDKPLTDDTDGHSSQDDEGSETANFLHETI